MTTILSRLYADAGTANGVRQRLHRLGFPRYKMQLIASNGEDASAIAKRIERARVPSRAASVYSEAMADGSVLLVVEAYFKPLGARKIAAKTLGETDSLPVNLKSQDFKVDTIPDHAPNVMKDHPRFLTAPPDPDHVGGPLSDQFGFSMVSATRKRNSAKEGGGLMFPFAALSTRSRSSSVMSGGSYMSRMFWPMKLITNNNRRKSVISGGGHPFSRLFGMRTTS